MSANTFFILNFSLDVFDRIRRLYFKCNRLAGEGLDEDLHATAKTQYQVERRLFLNVVIRESTPVFKLLASKDETLLIGRDA